MIERFREKIKSMEGEPKLSFWFVRHGESEGNILGDATPLMQDTPLTERGRQEAQDIAKYLQQNAIKVTHIYSSSKGRAHETAEIIGLALGLPVIVKTGLNERDWGDWKDLKWNEASERLDKMPMEERYSFVPKDGESWEQMEKRLFSTLEEIADESIGGENVLIVTHRGCLRAIMPKLAKAGIEKHKEFSVPTGSLSKFSFDKDEFDFVGLIPKE